MKQEELINVFKYIVKKCDMLINDCNYEADAYTQDIVEDIAELCNHILDGDYGKLLEVKEVDLEKEIDNYFDNYKIAKKEECWLNHEQTHIFAKHFFELGLKAQIMTSKLQQRISVLKMGFWTGLQMFEETEMTLSDAYNQGVDDILEELGLKAQKGEEV